MGLVALLNFTRSKIRLPAGIGFARLPRGPARLWFPLARGWSIFGLVCIGLLALVADLSCTFWFACIGVICYIFRLLHFFMHTLYV